jgi:hypothetical protein
MGLKVRSRFGRILLISGAWFVGLSSVGLMIGLKATGMLDALGELREREAKAKELCLVATAEELQSAYYVPDRRNSGPEFSKLLVEFERESNDEKGRKRYGLYGSWWPEQALNSADPTISENRRLVREFWSRAERLLKQDHVRFRYKFKLGHGAMMSEAFWLSHAANNTLGDAFWLAMEGKNSEALQQFERAESLRRVAQDNFASDLALIQDESILRKELKIMTMLASRGSLTGGLRLFAQKLLVAEASFKNANFTRKVQLFNDIDMVTASDIRSLALNMGLKDEDIDRQLWIKLQPISMFQSAWKSAAIGASLKLKEMCDAQKFQFVDEYQLASQQADDERISAGYLPSLPWARMSSFRGVGASELPAIREELRKAMQGSTAKE